jgi:hypothetical protein
MIGCLFGGLRSLSLSLRRLLFRVLLRLLEVVSLFWSPYIWGLQVGSAVLAAAVFCLLILQRTLLARLELKN